MSDTSIRALYDDTPIPAKMAAWLLLGIGGLVLLPIAVVTDACWLLILAIPLLVAGLVLLQVSLRIVIEHQTGEICTTDFLFGLKLRERHYSLEDVAGLDLYRLAGNERERPSDTWYLRLRLDTTVRTFGKVRPGTRTYIIGRYESQLRALKAQRQLREVLEVKSEK